MDLQNWINKTIKKTEEKKEEIRAKLRFKRYCLEIQNKKPGTNGKYYRLYRKGPVYYLGYYYSKNKRQFQTRRQIDKIEKFYAFTKGDPEQYTRHLSLYTEMIRSFLGLTGLEGFITLAAIPSSRKNKESILCQVVRDIVKKQPYKTVICRDDSGLLKRKYSIKPISGGARYKDEELKNSMILTRSPKGETVILLDDIVRSGQTARVCHDYLISTGAKKVYVLCLYAVQ